jgi:excinuclease UvrABC nuclease subunit
MPEISTLLPSRADFDPAGDFETFLRLTPARWVVYLLTDAQDRPVQLLCVKNLRYSLKRRLGGQEMIGLSRRVNYRELVRHVHWRRVDSTFEADWIYFEAARIAFPQSYRGMVGLRPAWFIHVNPETNFPRYVKTIDLSRSGLLLGPVEDKHAAARLIELLEDSFDLCRFYPILIEAPNGKACAYKGMGKCPAPCDGSISVDQYHRMIQRSADVLLDPEPAVREQQNRMKQAAADLQFEVAAKIKSFAEQLGRFGKGAFRFVRKLREFEILSIQPGPRPNTAKIFLITPGQIDEILGVTGTEARGSQVLGYALSLLASRTDDVVDAVGAERIGVVSNHLFSAKHRSGVFLPIAKIDEPSVARALRELERRPADEAVVEEEGVVKELQSMAEES